MPGLSSTSTPKIPTSDVVKFTANPKQAELNKLLSSTGITHVMAYGGSRSGKSFWMMRAVCTRAIKEPNTRHAVFRFRFNHVKNSIVFDTFPTVMKLCFPDVTYKIDKTDWFAEFPNGSRIIFGGLDDAERTEKILGLEFSTIFLNECSQISFDARNKALTRLAQKSGLKLKFYYDCNPPNKSHWTYRLFEQKVDPKSGESIRKPEAYASIVMNPGANVANLAPEYIEELESLPAKDRARFLLGKFADQVDGALWTPEMIGRFRLTRSQLPDLQRIVVAVDPSGCSGPEDKRSDEIGIVAAGVDAQGIGYVLEDATGRYSPEGWAKKAAEVYDRWYADRIVAEKNFGGALVESNLRGYRASLPVRLVTASRGKAQRAEPIAGLYEQRKVAHVSDPDAIGGLADLEDQLCLFNASGYQGSKSPDRADACVWALTDLMLDGSGYDTSMNWV